MHCSASYWLAVSCHCFLKLLLSVTYCYDQYKYTVTDFCSLSKDKVASATGFTQYDFCFCLFSIYIYIYILNEFSAFNCAKMINKIQGEIVYTNVIYKVLISSLFFVSLLHSCYFSDIGKNNVRLW